MKNVFLFLLISFCTLHSLSAQDIHIPDANFKNALIALNIDNGDDEISQAEALAITSLNVSGESISDLTGIENFTNLQYLDCYNNSLDSLDVSDLTNLQFLYCEYNSLSSLDVSGLTNLQFLRCYNNSLTSLDVSGLTNLQYLRCYNNSLDSLDVSDLTNLQYLSCYNNSLTTIDIRSTPELFNFLASNNPDLACIVVDDVNDLPFYWSVDQDVTIFTTEPCVASFEGLSILVQGLGFHSFTEAALLSTLQVAEVSCTAGKKWLALASLISLDAMVSRLQLLGRLSAGEAGQFLEASGLLQDNILSGAVDCSSEPPANILDWITSWYSIDASGEIDSDESATVHPGSQAVAVQSVPRIYPNPTSGHVTFSYTVKHVEVYNMMGQLMTKSEHTDHLDLHSYQAGVYVIHTMDDEGARNVQRVVKR